MPDQVTKTSARRLTARSAAAAFVAVLGLAMTAAAPAAGQTISYPPSRSLADIAVWLQHETPIAPAQVVDIAPTAITAIVSALPTGEPRGFLANLSSEALDPNILGQEGIVSWTIPVEVDCDKRAVRLGMMTGFHDRALKADPKVVRQPDTVWVSPTSTAPLGAVMRALCDRDFRRPLVGGSKLAAKAPEPVKAPRPSAAATPAADATPAKSKPAAGHTVSAGVQVGASPDLAETKTLLVRFQKKFAADLQGLSGDVVTVQVDGKTVHRAVISGFGSVPEATALCEKLKAAGQACFVRR